MYSLSLLIFFAALSLFLLIYGTATRTPPLALAGFFLLLVAALICLAMRYPPIIGFAV